LAAELSAYLGAGNAQAGGVLKHFLRISQLLSETKVYEKKLPSHRNPQRFAAHCFEAEKSLPFSTNHTHGSFHKLRCEKQ
jgi:hypothetical protein